MSAEFVLDGARAFQAMVAMRDGVRLNTFVFLPLEGGPRLAGHPATHPLRHRRRRCARQDRLRAGVAGGSLSARR